MAWSEVLCWTFLEGVGWRDHELSECESMILRKSQSNKKHGSSLLILGAKVQMLEKTLAWFIWKKQSKQRQSNMWPVWLLCLPEDGSRESPKSSSFRGNRCFAGTAEKILGTFGAYLNYMYIYELIYIIYIHDTFMKYKDWINVWHCWYEFVDTVYQWTRR